MATSDKWYQVFIASPFKGLEEERSKALNAVLLSKCFPLAMELFPADPDTESFINRLIEGCDIFVLILAGRYGLGYAEKEFDFAKELGKPILAFLRKNWEKTLPGEKLDEERSRIRSFRKKVQNSGCLTKEYTTPDDLSSGMIASVTSYIRSHEDDLVGWVRASDVMTREEALTIKEENIKLQRSATPRKAIPFRKRFGLIARVREYSAEWKEVAYDTTMKSIFLFLGPKLRYKPTQLNICRYLSEYVIFEMEGKDYYATTYAERLRSQKGGIECTVTEETYEGLREFMLAHKLVRHYEVLTEGGYTHWHWELTEEGSAQFHKLAGYK